MTSDTPENDPTADPEYAAARALWNGMSLQARSRLLRLVLDLGELVAQEERDAGAGGRPQP